MNKRKQQGPTGALTQRVRLEKPVYASDNAGGHTTNWELVSEVWAEIKPTRQRSSIDASARHAQNFYEVRLYNRGDLRVGQRFVWREQLLEIFTIEQVGAEAPFITVITREANRL